MKRKMRQIIRATVTTAVMIATFTVTALAEVPYKTYTVDGYGHVSETQTAYTPVSAITKIGEETLGAPTDMVISKDGLLYVADAGKKVIMVSDLEGNKVKTIGEGKLQNPCGVCVTSDNKVYVADKDAGKILVFDENGKIINEYGKPTSPIYGEKQTFKPTKIAVNDSGNMYIVCEGNTNGIVEISPASGGSFLGYFGTNFTSLNPLQAIQRMILTDAQRAKLLGNIPSTPTNLFINDDGLVITVTQGGKESTLKKLNIAGTNLLDPDPYFASLPVAVTTGNYDNIVVADNDGYVYEYNDEGELLFVFGGRDDGRYRIGLCSKVEAVAVDKNDRIFLLDSDKRQIHVFKSTEFTDLLHNALSLYTNGRYTESKEPLKKVLTMNSMFDYANKAIGRAYLQEENYDMSLKYAKLSKDFDGYSDAFWEVRNNWLQNNLVTAFLILVALFIIITAIKKLQKKNETFYFITEPFGRFKKRKLPSCLFYSKKFMKHPIDGSYAVKREGKSSYLCANIIIALFIMITIIDKYFCGFLFRTVREGRYNLVSDIGSVILIFLAVVICHYLVVTINDGEGSFKQVYCAFAYCLTPYLILKPLIIIVSNVITYNEAFIVQFADIFVIAWICVLLFIAIKEVNAYTVKETIKIILLTLFTILIMALILFIVYVLVNQVIDFITTVFREVVYRIG